MVYSARSLRLARWLPLALLAGCGDAATDGIGPGAAALAVAPAYPAEYQPGTLNLVVDQVKVRVLRPPSEWVVDTSATFPADAPALTMQVRVPLKSRVERMDVVLELWAGPLLVFSGSQNVEVWEGAGTGQPASIPLTYRGPGAEARNIRITPRDTVLRPGERFRFGIQADNGSGVPVGDVYVAWSVSGNAAANVNAAGELTAAGQRGSVMLAARSATGARDSTRIWFAPAPVSVEAMAGGGQAAVVGSDLPAPFVARVLAADGLGVPGVLVHFSASSGGSVHPAAARTDGDGVARGTVTLGGLAGIQSFQGSVAGVGTVQFVATAEVDVPAQIAIVRGNNQIAPPGQPVQVPLEVIVTDRFGNSVRDARVTWEVLAGDGVLGLTESLTDGAGRALSAYTMGPGTATNLVRATMAATGAAVVFVLQVGP